MLHHCLYKEESTKSLMTLRKYKKLHEEVEVFSNWPQHIYQKLSVDDDIPYDELKVELVSPPRQHCSLSKSSAASNIVGAGCL